MEILIYSIFLILGIIILQQFVFNTNSTTFSAEFSNFNSNVIYCYGKQMYKRKKNRLRMSRIVKSKHK